jgi:N-acetyl-gamma-glutamyl-phosphate reductase
VRAAPIAEPAGLPAPARPPESEGGAPSAAAFAPAATARVVVLGASGYTGQEFVRLAGTHRGIELTLLASREHAGEPLASSMPGLDPRERRERAFAGLEDGLAAAFAGECDVLVSCLPHGVLAERLALGPELPEALRVLDLSADHRGGEREFRYGLPEAHRDVLSFARRVANPGCYPTAATLALLPALEGGWLSDPVMVSAVSGVSGAGRGAAKRTSFVELDGGASIYRAGDVHPHTAEIARNVQRLSGATRAIGFTPQLAPMARGILLTVSAPLQFELPAEDARRAYAARYAGEPFVRLLPAGEWPETRAVRASNRCDVAVTTLHGGRTLLATAAIDNLVKGAAGQAIQNLNLMFGWPETHGLPRDGSPW